ncbi:hypothetical protein Cob_v000513 [Colletotrichum orbiculare MAFF 240422]|uniref:Uncharacterized protein n=1 Tax=Colletotrichum orbiculare (strain 104-T / ATCC 96160 / CBS 514.97 / LARS 414 / MAFF 240422) TaxID=1213857 RepID=A0A484G7W7_COLOR|nr:hypothetical protein Cob_v000513 [Colletotrichum orbiculare MAFF 240422]
MQPAALTAYSPGMPAAGHIGTARPGAIPSPTRDDPTITAPGDSVKPIGHCVTPPEKRPLAPLNIPVRDPQEPSAPSTVRREDFENPRSTRRSVLVCQRRFRVRGALTNVLDPRREVASSHKKPRRRDKGPDSPAIVTLYRCGTPYIALYRKLYGVVQVAPISVLV